MKIKSVLAKALFLPVCCILAGAMLAGCATPPSPDVLRVGCVTDFAPLIYKDGRGEISGVEADLARALGDRLGRKTVFVPMDFDRLLDALLADKVDIVFAGLTATDARRVRVDFCNPYLVIAQAAVCRTKEARKYRGTARVATTPERVGVVAGTTGDELVSSSFVNAQKITFSKLDDAIWALRKNAVDLVVAGEPFAWYAVAQHASELSLTGARMTEEALAWAVRPGNHALRQAANEALAAWQTDGTLDRIFENNHCPFTK